MQAGTIRLLAVLMGTVHGQFWVLATRWERPGRTAPFRTSLHPPLTVRAGDLALVVALLYPVVVAVAPGWGYQGRWNWSSRFDTALLGAGLRLWVAGVFVSPLGVPGPGALPER